MPPAGARGIAVAEGQVVQAAARDGGAWCYALTGAKVSSRRANLSIA